MFRIMLTLLHLALSANAQQTTYRGMGSYCQGPGFFTSKLGDRMTISTTDGTKVIIAGCQIIPDSLFFTVGFTLDELSKYQDRSKWIYATGEFNTKVEQMHSAWALHRQTLINGVDNTAPTITSDSAAAASDSAVITWATDEPSDSQILYGETIAYGSQTGIDATMALNHTVTITGLKSGTLIYYRIKTSDMAGNLTISSGRTVTTLSQPIGQIRFVDGEVPVGTIDGANSTFTLANQPSPASSLKMYRNGLRLRIGADYSASGSRITFLPGAIPQATDLLSADYRY